MISCYLLVLHYCYAPYRIMNHCYAPYWIVNLWYDLIDLNPIAIELLDLWYIDIIDMAYCIDLSKLENWTIDIDPTLLNHQFDTTSHIVLY